VARATEFVAERERGYSRVRSKDALDLSRRRYCVTGVSITLP